MIHKLSAKAVENSKPGLLGDGDGLWLKTRQRQHGITRRFVFRYRRDGKHFEVPIGKHPSRSLTAARAKAHEFRALLDAGGDPATARREQRIAARAAETAVKVAAAEAAYTFQVAAREWLAAKGEPSWRGAKTSRVFWSNMERTVFPVLGDTPITNIDRKAVIAMLKPVAAHSLTMMHKVRGWCERIYSYGASHLDLEGTNPFAWKDGLENIFAKKPSSEHLKALPFTQLPGLYNELVQLGDAPDALAARFQIALALRPTEARLARYDMIDEAAGTITWPLTKNGRSFAAPLNEAAMGVINRCRAIRSSEFLFAGRDGVSLVGMRAIFTLVARLTEGCSAHATARSGFSDWAYETQPQIPDSVIESCLNHAVGNKVTRAYKRGSQLELRRAAMAAWSDFLLGIVPATNVVPFRTAVG
jgi:integrase